MKLRLFNLISLYFLTFNTALADRPQPNVSLPNKIVYQAPDFEVTARKLNSALEIKAVAPPAHHFNTQAPMSLVRTGTSFFLEPTQKGDKIIYFRVTDLRTASYEIILYLCDDAKTFCEKHKIQADWNGLQSELKTRPSIRDTASLNSLLKPSAKNSTPVTPDGFILNRADEALTLAHQSHKPLLIDFFGIWCPSCNELDEIVFSAPEFKNRAASFIKLKLDVDLPESWALKSKYKVTSYPTVIFATPNGDEINRIVGFRSETVFSKYMEEVTQSLSSSAPPPNFRSPANVNPKGILLTHLRDQSHRSPADLKRVIDLAQDLLKKPESETNDDEFTHADLWTVIAESYEDLHDLEKSKEAWKQGCKEFRKKIKSGQERGYHLELAHCLWKSGDYSEADQIYQKFEALYPKEFTFYFNHAAMKLSQEKWTESETLGKKALNYSYGDNLLRVTLLVAKSLQGQNRNSEARDLIHQTLESFKLPKDSGIRTHQYFQQLKDFSSKL